MSLTSFRISPYWDVGLSRWVMTCFRVSLHDAVLGLVLTQAFNILRLISAFFPQQGNILPWRSSSDFRQNALRVIVGPFAGTHLLFLVTAHFHHLFFFMIVSSLNVKQHHHTLTLSKAEKHALLTVFMKDSSPAVTIAQLKTSVFSVRYHRVHLDFSLKFSLTSFLHSAYYKSS